MGHEFSGGWKSLTCRGNDPEALVSRKVVRGDPYTEGSETAKSGTDDAGIGGTERSELGNTIYILIFLSKCKRYRFL